MSAGKRTVKVEILGEPRGGKAAFADLDASAGKSEGILSKLGGVFGNVGKAAVAGFAVAGTAAVAVGGALFAVGDKFDSAFDTIRTGTGATGEALNGLEGDFKSLVSSVPTDFDSAATAIADLNTRLGLTGQPLQDLSEQFINLARITGEDLPTSIANGTRVFGDWSIATEDQGRTLDYLFKVSQSTGIGVNDLMAKVVQFGAPLRQMGFGLEESAALLGKFEKEGVNAELVMGSMRQALGKMARAGEDPIETFGRVTEAIKNAGSTSEANGLAMELFGARAGPDMAAAIREGRFGVEDLMATLDASGETINKAAEDTFDFGEKWTLFKNRALVAIQPVAEKVFELAGTIMDRLGPAILTILPVAIEWFTNLAATVQEKVVPAVMAAAAFFQDTLWPIIESGLGVIRGVVDAFGEGGIGGALAALPELIGPHLAKVGELFLSLGQSLIAWVEPMIPPLMEKLGELALSIGDWVVNTGLPMLAEQLGLWADAFGAWAVEAVPPMLESLGLLLESLGTWIADEGLPLLFDRLQLWGQALTDWIGPRIVPVLTALGELLFAIGEWIITEALPAIAAKLWEWGAQFVAWVAPQIGPLLSELGTLLVNVGSWMVNTALPEIIAKLSQWASEFVAWVAPQIPPLLSALGTLLMDLGSWMVNTALPEIMTKLTQWGAEFVAWVAPQIPPLLVELGKLLIDLGAWVTGTALPEIIGKLAQWAEAFLGWIASDVLPQLPIRLAAIIGTIGQWVTDNISTVAGKVVAIGTAVLEGIASGIRSGASSIVGAAISAAMDLIPGWARKALGIESPAKVMIPIGLAVVDGVAVGIERGSPSVEKAAYAAGKRTAESYAAGVTDGSAPPAGDPDWYWTGKADPVKPPTDYYKGSEPPAGDPDWWWGPKPDPKPYDYGKGSEVPAGDPSWYWAPNPGPQPPKTPVTSSDSGDIIDPVYSSDSGTNYDGPDLYHNGGGGGGSGGGKSYGMGQAPQTVAAQDFGNVPSYSSGQDRGVLALTEGASFVGCSWQLTGTAVRDDGSNNDWGLFERPNGKRFWEATRFCRNGATGPTAADYKQAANRAKKLETALAAASPNGHTYVKGNTQGKSQSLINGLSMLTGMQVGTPQGSAFGTSQGSAFGTSQGSAFGTSQGSAFGSLTADDIKQAIKQGVAEAMMGIN